LFNLFMSDSLDRADGRQFLVCGPICACDPVDPHTYSLRIGAMAQRAAFTLAWRRAGEREAMRLES
jgi:hypothetical protein